MHDPKPVRIVWSRAAVAEAGPDLFSLDARVVEEMTEISAKAIGWFYHAIPDAAEAACFLCQGHELADTWQIFVQLAAYKSSVRTADDHPDPERRGKVIQFPEVIEHPDNEVFASIEDLSH